MFTKPSFSYLHVAVSLRHRHQFAESISTLHTEYSLRKILEDQILSGLLSRVMRALSPCRVPQDRVCRMISPDFPNFRTPEEFLNKERKT